MVYMAAAQQGYKLQKNAIIKQAETRYGQLKGGAGGPNLVGTI
jgi:hypothetical protein